MNEIKAKVNQSSTVVGAYRYFYYLANEMTYKAIHDEHEINTVRYSAATVILSFTTIETFVNHFLHAKDTPHFEELGASVLDKVERMTFLDKIELAYTLSRNTDQAAFARGAEPIQSLEALRDLRNYLVHNKPTEEITFKEGSNVEDSRSQGEIPYQTG